MARPSTPHTRMAHAATSEAPAPVEATPPTQPTPQPSAPPEPPPPSKPNPILAWLTGGNTIARVGLLILFFGLAFLLKYAADQDMLPVELRVAAVAAGGVALLLLGWRLRERRPAYALAMQGAGVAVLYLTTFAALRLWALIPAEAAFILLALIAVFAAFLAVAQDAMVLAVIAAGGGFLAGNLAGRLVLAKALERRMPQDAVRGFLGEGDLRDQHRIDPVHAGVDDLVCICRGIDRPIGNAIIHSIVTVVIDPIAQAIGPVSSLPGITHTSLWRRRTRSRARCSSTVAMCATTRSATCAGRSRS